MIPFQDMDGARRKLGLGEGESAFLNTDDEAEARSMERDFLNGREVAEEDEDEMPSPMADSSDGVPSLDRLHGVNSFYFDGICSDGGRKFAFGQIATFDSNGELMWRYDLRGRSRSRCGSDYYRFSGLRSQGLAIPQIKEMNCTVRPEWASHRVYVETVGGDEFASRKAGAKVDSARSSGLGAKEVRLLSERMWDLNKISFDKWILMGALCSIMLRIYRGFTDGGRNEENRGRMPDCIYVRYADLYRSIFPDRDYRQATLKMKEEFVGWCMDCFDFFNGHAMHFTNPVFGRREREWVHDSRILETYPVQEMNPSGTWRESGVRVMMRGFRMWESIRKRRRYVRIYDYELKSDVQKRFSMRIAFVNIYLRWFISSVNYHLYRHTSMSLRRGSRYVTKSDVENAFAGGAYAGIKPTASLMERIFYHSSIEYLGEYDEEDFKKNRSIRPAHVKSYLRIGDSRFEWEMPNSLKGEDVTVRDSEGNKRRIGDGMVSNEEVAEAQMKMKIINDENRRHRVKLGDEWVETHLQAIFHTEDRLSESGAEVIERDRNGRQYTSLNGFQSLSKAERLRMTIDGQGVCEVDFSSLHPRMLYAMEGIDYQGDVYDLGGFHRKIGLSESECREAVKLMLLVAINSEHMHNGIYAFKEGWIRREADILRKSGDVAGAEMCLANMKKRGMYKIWWAWSLFHEIERRHSAIGKYFGSGMGTRLQCLDGRLMRSVCAKMAIMGICSCPVHDSVVVQQRHCRLACELMEKYYRSMFNGMSCPVKVEFPETV